VAQVVIGSYVEDSSKAIIYGEMNIEAEFEQKQKTNKCGTVY